MSPGQMPCGALLGLSRRESWWKDAEILMLRHQLEVAGREWPRAHTRLTWPDRAWLALLAGTLPLEGLRGGPADRDPGHGLAAASGHRAPQLGLPVAPGPLRASAGAPHSPAGGAAPGPGENQSWGYRRIHAGLAGPGVTVAPWRVWEILRRAGIAAAGRP